MTSGLVGLIRAAWIGLARFPYSSIHACAYDHAIELPDFFGYGRLPCVPCLHDTCFHEADKSVLYRFVCLWTANSGPAVSAKSVVKNKSIAAWGGREAAIFCHLTKFRPDKSAYVYSIPHVSWDNRSYIGGGGI